MWVQSLGWEDSLEEEMATHSSILAWRIPVDIEAWQATVHKVAKSRTRLKQLSTHISKPRLQMRKPDREVKYSAQSQH